MFYLPCFTVHTFDSEQPICYYLISKFTIRYYVICERPPKRLLVRPNWRWEDTIKWNLKKQLGSVDWEHSAQDEDKWSALVSMAMNFGIP